MALRAYKNTITLDKLYRVDAYIDDKTICPVGGNVTIYHLNSEAQPADLARMNLDSADTAITTKKNIDAGVPRWLAFTGTATSVDIDGVSLTEIGDIS